MRMLLVHARKFRYKAVKKALEEAEELNEARRELSVENALVAYVTVEEHDILDKLGVARRASEEIAGVARKVGAKIIVVYPYAHLSSSLASPGDAVEVLADIENALANLGYSVYRAPFGWYKEFMLECYGHPLSELSRTIEAGEQVSEPRYYAYDPGTDSMVEAPPLLAGLEDLPESRRALEFSAKFGFEPSRPYVLRNISLELFRLAEKRASSILRELVEEEVERLDLGCVEEPCDRCMAPGYSVIPSRLSRSSALLVKMHLRVRGCSDSFTMTRPARIVGLQISLDSVEEAVRFATKCLGASRKLAPWINTDEIVVVADVHERDIGSNWLKGMLSSLGIRGMVRAWSNMCGKGFSLNVYWAKGSAALSALLRITATWRRRGVVEVFASIPRSLEDLVYTYMVKAALMEAEGRAPMIPLWLSPIQVRVIPVSEEHAEYARLVASMLEKQGVRVDIDQHGRGLGRRIRRAGTEWIPYVVVVGGRELETGTVNVRIRSENKQVSMTPEELAEHLKRALEDGI